MTKPHISRDRLLAWLRYDADAGLFFDHDDKLMRVMRGGYPFTRVTRRYYPTQHLVWLVETGEYPDNRVRFIDGDPLNTRFSNLRCLPPVNNFVATAITRELILKHFDYDPETGSLTRGGKIAGTLLNGYRAVSFAGQMRFHRQLVWTIETGEWPTERIYAINRHVARDDCRFKHLRLDQRVTLSDIGAHERGEIELKPFTLSRAERFDDFAAMQRMLPENRGIKEAELLVRFDQMILAEMLA